MPPLFIDYNQLLDDFAAAVTVADLGFRTVLIDADAREYLVSNAPLLDLRLKKLTPQATTNATYFSDLAVEAEIFAHSLLSRHEAAKIRNDLTAALQQFVKTNPRFSAVVETIIVGPADFGTGESVTEGAFVAGTVCEFHPQLWSE